MKKLLVILPLLIALNAKAEEGVNLQYNALEVPVRASELKGFRTVEQAAKYFLGKVGYSLKTSWPAPVESVFIVSLPIRPSAISNKVIPMNELLVSMVSDKYILVVDHYSRSASFAPLEEKNYVPRKAVEEVFSGNYIVEDSRLLEKNK
jgi:hypothetical protein